MPGRVSLPRSLWGNAGGGLHSNNQPLSEPTPPSTKLGPRVRPPVFWVSSHRSMNGRARLISNTGSLWSAISASHNSSPIIDDAVVFATSSTNIRNLPSSASGRTRVTTSFKRCLANAGVLWDLGVSNRLANWKQPGPCGIHLGYFWGPNCFKTFRP